MNIFVVNEDPIMSAKALCDQHVCKMIVESAQILSSVCPQGSFDGQYKVSHKNHPCVKWAGATYENFSWLRQHALVLCEEYSSRFGKVHKSKKVIDKSLYGLMKSGVDIKFDNSWPENFISVVPEDLKTKNVVESYRKYYNRKSFDWWMKGNPMRWTNSLPHSWFYGPKELKMKYAKQ